MGSEPTGLEIGTVAHLALLQERGEVVMFTARRNVAQGEGGFPTDRGAWLLSIQFGNKNLDIFPGITEGPKGDKPGLGVGTSLQQGTDNLQSLSTQHRKKPDGPGPDVAVAMAEELTYCRNSPGPRSLEALQSSKANILGWIT